MDKPEACLSPAVCYHVYHMHQNQSVPAAGLVYGICGKCFRYGKLQPDRSAKAVGFHDA